MMYVDWVIQYVEDYGCTTEEAEKMVDSDLDSGFIKVDTDEDYFKVSAEDYREWSLASTGLTEADVPYSCRYV